MNPLAVVAMMLIFWWMKFKCKIGIHNFEYSDSVNKCDICDKERD